MPLVPVSVALVHAGCRNHGVVVRRAGDELKPIRKVLAAESARHGHSSRVLSAESSVMEPNGAPMPRLALSSATSSTWLSSSGDSMAEAISATTVSSSMRCRRFLAAIALSVCVSSLARCGADLQVCAGPPGPAWTGLLAGRRGVRREAPETQPRPPAPGPGAQSAPSSRVDLVIPLINATTQSEVPRRTRWRCALEYPGRGTSDWGV